MTNDAEAARHEIQISLVQIDDDWKLELMATGDDTKRHHRPRTFPIIPQHLLTTSPK